MNTAYQIKKKIRGAGKRLANLLTPDPVQAYGERTILHLPQRGPSVPNDRLLDLALKAIQRARELSLSDLTARQWTGATDFPDLWPGEHYRLLAALVDVLQPGKVVEVGTLEGLSSLALKKFLPPQGQVVTFDLVPWNQFEHTVLRPDDLADGRLRQELGDLADPRVFDQHRALLAEARMIFLDGPKDAIFERRFLENLATLRPTGPLLLFFDDIHIWNMLDIWREIDRPKLDLTSFGHWTGSGLVEWQSDEKR